MTITIKIEIPVDPNHPDLNDFINDMKDCLWDYIKNFKFFPIYHLTVNKEK